MNTQMSQNLPESVFPYACVSERLVLDHDEIDDIMDELFADLFEGDATEPPASNREG